MNLFDECYFIIPARLGSKGFPNKNRLLINYTLQSIPKHLYNKVIVTTNDDYIINYIKKYYYGINIHIRKEELCTDTSDINEVLTNVSKDFKLKDDDNLILMYLTYPQRTFKHIKDIVKFYKSIMTKSLLCALKPKTHPYLCMYDLGSFKGKQVISHNMNMRQEYPNVFQISHFLSICKVNELKILNKNLYNDNTIFFKLGFDIIDVDNEHDLKNFEQSQVK